MKETYKEEIDKKEMPEDVYGMINVMEIVKEQTLKKNPTYAEDFEEIPNAGIYTYNKINEFIKKIEEKSITDKSVLYAILKRNLLLSLDENIFDIIAYGDNEEEKEVEFPQKIEKKTRWSLIRKYIRRKIFSVYLTEEYEEMMMEYIDKRNEARKKHRNRVIDNVENIGKIELDEEFIKTSILNFLSVEKFEKDFNPEVLIKEVGEELEKLGMSVIMQEVEKEINESVATLRARIKIDNKNNTTNGNVENSKPAEPLERE